MFGRTQVVSISKSWGCLRNGKTTKARHLVYLGQFPAAGRMPTAFNELQSWTKLLGKLHF